MPAMRKRSHDDNGITVGHNVPIARWLPGFPAPGRIPEPSHCDLPCPAVPIQRWYGNACLHVVGRPQETFGFFASFFRQCQDGHPSADSLFFDACTWAVMDNYNEAYYPDALLDHRALGVLQKRLDSPHTGRPTEHLASAILELVKKGRLPRPDRLSKGPATYTFSPTFKIELGDESVLEALDDGGRRNYHFIHNNRNRNVSIDVNFRTETKDPVLQGINGVIGDMFYYYYPRMTVTGTLTIDGVVREVEGSGWYDREFGGPTDATGRDALDCWTWFSLRLSNGCELSVYCVVDRRDGSPKEAGAVYTTQGRNRVHCADVKITSVDLWTSLVSFAEYPVGHRIVIPSIGFQCEVRTTFKAQEFVSVIAPAGGFLEGYVVGNGSICGASVSVTGFLEHKNLQDEYHSTHDLLKRVGMFVSTTLSKLYPKNASHEWVRENILGRHAVSTTPTHIVSAVLMNPVRYLLDRGGKSWRTLILVSCCNAISKDYFDCSEFIAMAELLHVGSLIMDDIEDNSVTRRGAKCVHLEYGLATAVNAGTACYFMAPRLAGIHNLPPKKGNQIFSLYFDLLCSGHAGQGMDIYGLDYLMPDVVQSGKTEKLFAALDAIHVYKTGGVAGTICRMACILCDATEDASQALEQFGLRLGLTFQIVDDVLDLKGFEGGQKDAAEDVREGKVTYPIAMAMKHLATDDREVLWNTLRSKPTDDAQVQVVIDLVTKSGAMKLCLAKARENVNASWAVLDPFLEDSLSKNMMRAFCTYLTDRNA